MSLPRPSSTDVESSRGEFSPEERAQLLQLAHESIASALEDRKLSLTPPTAHFAEPRGAFSSLYLHGKLRGCVGYVLPVSCVYQAVADTARAAAFEDSRFCPVKLEEARCLGIELSILSRPKAIAPEDVVVGRDGLLIGRYGYRGLLLPQVAVEHSWDRETFLEQTCQKAGLARDAWRKGASVEAFTAEVFGDHQR